MSIGRVFSGGFGAPARIASTSATVRGLRPRARIIARHRGGGVSRNVSRSRIRSGPSCSGSFSGIAEIGDGCISSMSDFLSFVVSPFASPTETVSPARVHHAVEHLAVVQRHGVRKIIRIDREARMRDIAHHRCIIAMHEVRQIGADRAAAAAETCGTSSTSPFRRRIRGSRGPSCRLQAPAAAQPRQLRPPLCRSARPTATAFGAAASVAGVCLRSWSTRSPAPPRRSLS